MISNCKTYLADSSDAQIICANIARRAISSRIAPRHNQRVFFIRTEQLARIMTVKVRQPIILLPAVRFIIELSALLRPETGLILLTRIRIACPISHAFANTERTAILGRRMIALPALHRYAAATLTRAFAPLVPIAPATIDRCRLLLNRYAFLILTPLVLAAVCARCSRPQLCYTHIVHHAPQLRANFVWFRTHAHRIFCRIELQFTLQVGVVHRTRRQFWVREFIILRGGIVQAFAQPLVQEVCDITATAIGPWHLHCVRLEARCHHMYNRTGATVAAGFFRVMVHSETVCKWRINNRRAEI